MKDENYYIVHGWMKNQLHLKGTEKEIYAILYGFTQDGKTEFRGGIDYLVDATGKSESKIRQNINNLVKKGLVIKTKHGNETNGLRAVAPDVKRRVAQSKSKNKSTKASYDIEAFKHSALMDDLVYERKSEI